MNFINLAFLSFVLANNSFFRNGSKNDCYMKDLSFINTTVRSGRWPNKNGQLYYGGRYNSDYSSGKD